MINLIVLLLLNMAIKESNPKIFLWDNTTNVYHWNKRCTKKNRANQGGTYSGKTIAILQNVIDDAIEVPKTRVVITSAFMPSLKEDALAEFRNLIENKRVRPFFKNPELVQGPYYLHNGSKITFKCYRNINAAKGAKRDILYISEADRMQYEIVEQLMSRTTRKVYYDYNPSQRFWAHEKTNHLEDTKVIISTFGDNKFCSKEKAKELIAHYQLYLQNGDEHELNFWRVYGQGKTGVLTGSVYTHINTISHFPDDYYLRSNKNGLRHVYGLDFGEGAKPTAICKMGIRSENERVVAQQIFYEIGFNNYDLKDKFAELGIRKGIDLIVADSANMAAIDILIRAGYKVIPAHKPPNSVKQGIEAIIKHGLDVVCTSYDFFEEQKSYHWKTIMGKRQKTEPTGEDHLFDALRYAFMYFVYGWGGERTIKVVKNIKGRKLKIVSV